MAEADFTHTEDLYIPPNQDGTNFRKSVNFTLTRLLVIFPNGSLWSSWMTYECRLCNILPQSHNIRPDEASVTGSEGQVESCGLSIAMINARLILASSLSSLPPWPAKGLLLTSLDSRARTVVMQVILWSPRYKLKIHRL